MATKPHPEIVRPTSRGYLIVPPTDVEDEELRIFIMIEALMERLVFGRNEEEVCRLCKFINLQLEKHCDHINKIILEERNREADIPIMKDF